MNFINLPVAFRGRRLIQVPCGSINTKKLNAGYDPILDATMAELPYKGGKFSLVLILPGKQTEFIAGGLSRIESRLNATLWNGLLRRMSPHNIDFKMPFFQHRSVIHTLKDAFVALNMTSAFSQDDADFSGVNGGRDLWMSEMIQLNEVRVEAGRQSRKETDQPQDNSSTRSAGRYKNFRKARRFSKRRFSRQADDQHHQHHHEEHDHHHDEHHHPDHNHHDGGDSGEKDASAVRIYFERQFMYAIRHNPTGMLVYIGRYYQPEEAVQQHNSHDNHQHHHQGHNDHH